MKKKKTSPPKAGTPDAPGQLEDLGSILDESREQIDEAYFEIYRRLEGMTEAKDGTLAPGVPGNELRTPDDIIKTSLFLYERLLGEVENVPVEERKKTLPPRQRALLAAQQSAMESNRRVLELRLESLRAVLTFFRNLAEATGKPSDTWAADRVEKILGVLEPLPSMSFGAEVLDWMSMYQRGLAVVEQLYASSISLLSWRVSSLLLRGVKPENRKKTRRERDRTWYRMLQLLVAEGLTDGDIRRRLREAKEVFPEAFTQFSADWPRLVDKYLREIHEGRTIE